MVLIRLRKEYFPVLGGTLTAIALAVLSFDAIPLIFGEPTVKIDYVAEYNRLTKPDGYEANENAALDYEKAYEVFVGMPEEIEDEWRLWPGEIDEDKLKLLRGWVGSNSTALRYLDEAVKKPYCWVERRGEGDALSNIEFPELAKHRHCVYSAVVRAKLAAYDGDVEGGLENALDVHRMGMHFLGPVTLVEQLVGTAVCGLVYNAAFLILAKTEVEPETLMRFQRRLEEQIQQSKPLDFSIGETIYGLDTAQRMFTDDGNGDGRLVPGKLVDYRKDSVLFEPISYMEAVLICMRHPGRKETVELSERLYKGLGGILPTTPWELRQKGTSYTDYAEEATKGNFLLNESAYAIGRVCEIYHRVKVSGEALVTAAALLRYRAERGAYPDSLEELVSGNYIVKLPRDPYGEGALVYKRTEGDFTLYSRGADFDDDGGRRSIWGEECGGDQVFWPVSEDR